MRLNLEQKKALVDTLSSVLAGAHAAALADYRGLSVAQMTTLRRKARDSEIFLRVVKNNLARRAVTGSEFECMQDQIVGPLALAAGADPVALAKVLSDFARDNEQLQIKAAVIEGKLLSGADLQTLASLPGREQLLAILAGTMQAPIRTFVQLLNEIPSRFVRTLAAVRDSKEKRTAA
jgi:large subunit ribosomal protein L10